MKDVRVEREYSQAIEDDGMGVIHIDSVTILAVDDQSDPPVTDELPLQ